MANLMLSVMGAVAQLERDLIGARVIRLVLKPSVIWSAGDWLGSPSLLVNALLVGTVTLIYGHDTRSLSDRLAALQHDYQDVVASTLHAHLDGDKCLKLLLLRKSKEAQQLGNSLISTRGVKHGRLIVNASETASSPKAYIHRQHSRP